jgi:putative oxidoreductase
MQIIPASWAPALLGILRIATALLVLEHATQKFLGFPVALQSGVPAMFGLYWWAGVIEVVFGILVLIGLWNGIAAFILSGHMAVVFWYGHVFGRAHSFWPVVNNGEFPALSALVLLFIAAAGPGLFSIDKAKA